MTSPSVPSQLAPVSAIIPCYNSADTIRRAVNSIAAQSWRPHELIVVDDGSTDDTPAILAALQEELGRDWLRIERLPVNRGVGAARNRAWELSSQPLLALLDADDTWHPQKIEVQCTWMLANPNVALTAHRSRTIDSHDAVPSDLGNAGGITAGAIDRSRMLWRNPIATRTVMLRRDVPLRFEPEKRRCQDYHLWLQLALSGYEMAMLDATLAFAFKAPYGAGGLTGSLWLTQLAELDAYKRLRAQKLISPVHHGAAAAFSCARFARRVVLTGSQQLRRQITARSAP